MVACCFCALGDAREHVSHAREASSNSTTPLCCDILRDGSLQPFRVPRDLEICKVRRAESWIASGSRSSIPLPFCSAIPGLEIKLVVSVGLEILPFSENPAPRSFVLWLLMLGRKPPPVTLLL